MCPNNAPTGCKRAPGGAAGMQQCRNDWQAWHILQGAQSRRSGRKQENCEKNRANCAAAMVSRARRCFSMGVWTCSLRGTQRQSHTHTHRDTHTACLFHSFSQALSVSGLQKSFGPWPSSRTRACLYSASVRSTVLSPGSFRSRCGFGMDALYPTY